MVPYWIKKKKAKKNIEPDLFGVKEKKKRKPDLVKKLDKVFALYIRLRDVMPSGYGKCISCGRIFPFSELDCGHFHGRTHMATRFDEDNCHIECKGCNRFSADHLIRYRDNLVAKIGMSRYDRLGLLAHSQKHWMDFELQEKIDYYTKEVKRLSADKGIRVNL